MLSKFGKSSGKLIILLSALVFSCQTGTIDNKRPIPIAASNAVAINADNIVQEQLKAVKHYSKEPLYYIFVRHEQCFFEILVNDVPVFRYFKDGGIMSPILLNEFITKSGKQKLTYRLYPQTKITGFPEGLKELTSLTSMQVTLSVRDNADTGSSFDNAQEILIHTSPKKDDGDTFIAAGKYYYEYSIDFEAEVPYSLDAGFEKGVDLRSLDSVELYDRVENAFQYYRNIIDERNKDLFYQLSFKSSLREPIAQYLSRDIIEEIHEYNSIYIDESTFEMQPLDKPTMKFYGNGRLVTLELESTDPRLQHKSAIWGTFKKGKAELAQFANTYLYLPEGKDAFEIW